MWLRPAVWLVLSVVLAVTPPISYANGLLGSTIVYLEIPFRHGSEDIDWKLGIGREALLFDVQQSAAINNHRWPEKQLTASYFSLVSRSSSEFSIESLGVPIAQFGQSLKDQGDYQLVSEREPENESWWIRNWWVPIIVAIGAVGLVAASDGGDDRDDVQPGSTETNCGIGGNAPDIEVDTNCPP